MLAGMGIAVLFAAADLANAAEIKVWTARAIATVLAEVGPQFERTTGHELTVATGLPADFMRRAAGSESFDVVITVASAVARGEVELGVIIITQTLTTPGVDLVGALPPARYLPSGHASLRRSSPPTCSTA